MNIKIFSFKVFRDRVLPLIKSRRGKYGIALAFVLFCVIQLFSAPLLYWPESSRADFMDHKNPRVILTSPHGKFGEQQAHRYMCSALKKLGYSPVCVYSNALMFIISYFMDIDVCISSDEKMICPKNAFNCLIVHWGLNQVKKKYDALLSIVPENYAKKAFPNESIFPFYFSVPSTKFNDTPKTRLFFGGCIWDKYRKSIVRNLYELLDNTGYFDLYGVKNWDGNSYRGLIPFGEDTVLKIMEKCGVTLVIHSDNHFKNNIPTARIFEAAAASTVIISDRLPFIVENFGDSVLYIDRNKSPEEMFKQIDSHMQWILSHPREAVELARRSHETFIKKFSLDEIMKKVMESYKNLKKRNS